jgi:hypothetical protein
MMNTASEPFGPLFSERTFQRLQVLCRATYFGSVFRNDPQKDAWAFVECLTDAECYTAKWLKSSSKGKFREDELLQRGSANKARGKAGAVASRQLPHLALVRIVARAPEDPVEVAIREPSTQGPTTHS